MNVYIDGENLRHRLVSVLEQAHKIETGEDYFRVDIPALVGRALAGDAYSDSDTEVSEDPGQIYYFTTRVAHPDFDIPDSLRDQITDIQQSHGRWTADLTDQGVQVVEAGLLKVKENAPCYHCGRRTMVLQEKGVDVRVATEMVMAAVHDKADTIAMLSGDTDIIPALEVVRRSGTKIIYVCFEGEVNEALERATDKTVTYSRQDILECAEV